MNDNNLYIRIMKRVLVFLIASSILLLGISCSNNPQPEEGKEYVKVEKEIIDKLKSERQKIKDTINVGKAADTVNDAIAVVERIIGEKNSEKEILCKKVRRQPMTLKLSSKKKKAIQCYWSLK